ncbi:MAG: hypothetical protein AB8I08_05900 [Sandaracinaceae bacterium]
MGTTAEGALSIEGDRLALGVPHSAGLPIGFFLVFVATPTMATLALLAFLVVAPESALGGLALLMMAAAMVLVPSGLGVLRMLLSVREGRRREVRIDLGEWLIQHPGRDARPLARPETIRVESHGLGWRLAMDDEVLVRAPYLAGHSMAAAATRLAEAMECELSVAASAHRARVPLTRNPRLLSALTYLPLDPISVPLSLWILATSTHAKARFAARQSLALELVELTIAALTVSMLAGPLLLLGVPAVVSLTLIVFALFGIALLRTLLRSALALRAGSGVVTVLPGLGWLLRRRPPSVTPKARRRASASRRRPRPHRPPPRVTRAPAGGLGPWWT